MNFLCCTCVACVTIEESLVYIDHIYRHCTIIKIILENNEVRKARVMKPVGWYKQEHRQTAVYQGVPQEHETENIWAAFKSTLPVEMALIGWFTSNTPTLRQELCPSPLLSLLISSLMTNRCWVLPSMSQDRKPLITIKLSLVMQLPHVLRKLWTIAKRSFFENESFISSKMSRSILFYSSVAWRS